MCNRLSARICLASALTSTLERFLNPKQMWRYHTKVTSGVAAANVNENNRAEGWKSYSTGIGTDCQNCLIYIYVLKALESY